LSRSGFGSGALLMLVICKSSKTSTPNRLTNARAALCWKSFRFPHASSIQPLWCIVSIPATRPLLSPALKRGVVRGPG
jgi:hypothetical protein